MAAGIGASANMSVLLETRQLSKDFGEFRALDDVSITV